ncbi:MAG: AmmeMemoRadiSam system protein B [Spirochaetia bacterium]|nr:AmmeMemoRadiSam system protein B [Spirochaetia bacterium]
MNSIQENIRGMKYAGSWYESDPDLLRTFLTKSLADAELRGSVSDYSMAKTGACLAMLPHAGLVYSARGIADFFANIPVKTKNIILVAPSHYVHIHPDLLTTADFTSAETPLVNLKVMPLHDLLPGRVVHIDRKALELEHALEMFLPFCANLQLQSHRKIHVGLCLISQVTSGKVLDLLSEAILEAVGDEQVMNGETLIIASSDFTHYGKRFGYTPFDATASGVREIEDQVLMHDRDYAEMFAEGNIRELLAMQERDQPTICGYAPGLLISNIAKQLNLTGKITNQYTSNSITGPSLDFVSYCSILWR